ncbi:MAG: serine/threonine-protein kinase RIO1 [Thermoproteota archaeon]|jgi:serine/threonine-protein kinase RIO1
MVNVSKKINTPTRSHNKLVDCGDYYIKSSTLKEKIIAEANYYEQLPSVLKKFHPNFLGRIDHEQSLTGYKIEKINEGDCSLFFVGILNDLRKFDNYFKLISEFFNILPTKDVSKELWIKVYKIQILDRQKNRIHELQNHHTIERVNDYYRENGYDSIEQFSNILQVEISKEIETMSQFKLWYGHGDLCFSNTIISDDKLYLIDPRGLNEDCDNYITPYYDFAKISQCVFGNYDFYNHFERTGKSAHNLSAPFEKLISSFAGNLKLVRFTEVSHFLSMLALHVNSPGKVICFAKQALSSYKDIK